MSPELRERAAAALHDAVHFLAARQDGDGFWYDYALPPGPSREWVTAFVGYALTGGPQTVPSMEAVGRAYAAVAASCRPAGWGYNPAVATDADTTSWAVRWFARGGMPLPLDPVPCLEGYLGAEGGARTFACGPRYGSWTHEHPDVTAVLGLALRETGGDGSMIDRVRRWLLGKRNAEGLWTSFWWTFDAYSHARALEFLDATGGVPVEVTAAARRSLGAPTPPASAMEEANLLMVALAAGSSPDPWISRLLGSRLPDGGWPPSRVLKVPDQKAPRTDDAAFADVHRLMSTAMAVMALGRFLEDGHEA
jgi:hypothetical protein